MHFNLFFMKFSWRPSAFLFLTSLDCVSGMLKLQWLSGYCKPSIYGERKGDLHYKLLPSLAVLGSCSSWLAAAEVRYVGFTLLWSLFNGFAVNLLTNLKGW